MRSIDPRSRNTTGAAGRGQSADVREEIESFLEKRDPVFADRVSDGLPEIVPGWREPEFR
jgi:hypothetical protein